jgi:LmbE family N-acetylglucosaminyl deacetylase
MARPVVILSPHLDDAAFACFSVLEGAVVINIFNGVPDPGPLSWWDERCGAGDSPEWARRRIAEDEAALAPYVSEIRSLGVLEAAYRPRGGADGDEIRPVVEEQLREHGDLLARSLVYAPLAGGAPQHSDHLDLREVTRALCEELGFALSLYADDGYCVTDGSWPSFLVEGGSDPPAWWQRLTAEMPEMGPLERARRVLLEPDRAAAKLAAMEAYETQWQTLNEVSDPPGVHRDPAIYSREFFWPLAR